MNGPMHPSNAYLRLAEGPEDLLGNQLSTTRRLLTLFVALILFSSSTLFATAALDLDHGLIGKALAATGKASHDGDDGDGNSGPGGGDDDDDDSGDTNNASTGGDASGTDDNNDGDTDSSADQKADTDSGSDQNGDGDTDSSAHQQLETDSGTDQNGDGDTDSNERAEIRHHKALHAKQAKHVHRGHHGPHAVRHHR